MATDCTNFFLKLFEFFRGRFLVHLVRSDEPGAVQQLGIVHFQLGQKLPEIIPRLAVVCAGHVDHEHQYAAAEYVPQKRVAQPDVVVSPFNDPRNVTNSQP